MYTRFEIKQFPAIVVNYITTVIVGTIVLGRFPIDSDAIQSDYFPYGIALGFLFISGFYLLAKTVEYFGVTITSIAQKMSLIMPIIFALLVFNESISTIKWIGIALALLAIVLINFPGKKSLQKANYFLSHWYIIVLTFVVSGFIDVMLYYVERSNISQNADIGFVVTLFSMAAVLGSIILIIGLLTKKMEFRWKELIGGVVLGVPNFFSIYGLLLLINKGYDGNVIFPVLNVSIIATAAIVGAVFFHEKLNRFQWIGFVVGILCIVFIALSS